MPREPASVPTRPPQSSRMPRPHHTHQVVQPTAAPPRPRSGRSSPPPRSGRFSLNELSHQHLPNLAPRVGSLCPLKSTMEIVTCFSRGSTERTRQLRIAAGLRPSRGTRRSHALDRASRARTADEAASWDRTGQCPSGSPWRLSALQSRGTTTPHEAPREARRRMRWRCLSTTARPCRAVVRCAKVAWAC